MAANVPYVGSKISLITTSDIRYEGILHALHREESTIAVQNVRSFGTEGRRSPEVPMSNEIYDFIIFRGKDLKDLTVMQGAAERPANPYACVPEYDASQMQNGLHNGHHDAVYAPQPPPPRAPIPQAEPYGYQQPYTEPAPGLGSFHNKAPASTAPARPLAGSNGLAQASTGLAQARNGYPLPTNGRSAPAPPVASAFNGNGFPSPPGIEVRRPVEKPSSLANTRQSYPAPPDPWQVQQQQPQQPSPQVERAPASLYEDSSSGSRLYADQPVKVAPPPPIARNGNGQHAVKDDWNAEPKDLDRDQSRSGGKGGPQKKQLHEVLATHPRARDQITKTMRTQNTASLQSTELRAMSETSPAVYSFFIDFVNYCCPSHMGNDEQQWEALCKALKRYFEKEFGTNGNQKPPAPVRPNNTLGDFITIQEAKTTKKGAKAAARSGGQPARGVAKKEPAKEENSRSEESGSRNASFWTCPRCTFKNENAHVECSMCGTPKEQAALWAEFPPLG